MHCKMEEAEQAGSERTVWRSKLWRLSLVWQYDRRFVVVLNSLRSLHGRPHRTGLYSVPIPASTSRSFKLAEFEKKRLATLKRSTTCSFLSCRHSHRSPNLIWLWRHQLSTSHHLSNHTIQLWSFLLPHNFPLVTTMPCVRWNSEAMSKTANVSTVICTSGIPHHNHVSSRKRP